MVTTSYQYPQYLYALQHDGESVQLPNGSWETPAAAWELKAVCREETNGKGSTIQTADGETAVVLEVNLWGMEPGKFVATRFEIGWNPEIVREIKQTSINATLVWGY